MDDDLPPAPDVAGVSLARAETFEISAADDAALCRSTGVEPATNGTAHPIWFYVATQVGMGKTVAGLCAACDFDIDDGPMMGGSRVDFAGVIRTGTRYRVEGEIKGLVRKRSRKLGVMDILEYELRLVTAEGECVLSTTNSWALPRRNLA
jgi:acyl dehydratase